MLVRHLSFAMWLIQRKGTSQEWHVLTRSCLASKLKTSHVSILTQKEWEQIDACMASLSGRGGVSFSCFSIFVQKWWWRAAAAVDQTKSTIWQNSPLSFALNGWKYYTYFDSTFRSQFCCHIISCPFILDCFVLFQLSKGTKCTRWCTWKNLRQKLPTLGHFGLVVKHVQLFQKRPTSGYGSPGCVWRIDGVWMAPPGEKKNKSLGKSTKQNNLIKRTKRSRGTAGNLGSHPCLPSKAGHKQRSQGGATPGSGRPSVKSTTTKPIWELWQGTRKRSEKDGQTDFMQ